MGEKWDKFKGKLGTKALTSLDTKTVSVLDNALAHLKRRANDKDKETRPSEATIKKINALADKYMMQKGKTIALYNKHKKKNPILRGLSVSALSVQKIYDVLGKNTKQAGPLKEAWLNDPGKVLQIAGGGIATAGAISALAGTGAPQTLFEIIKGFFVNSKFSLALRIGVGALGAGVLVFAGGTALKKYQRSRANYLSEQQKAEEAMNEGTVKDAKHMASALDNEAIKKLAAEASIDNDYILELQSIIADPFSNPIAAENAIKILDQAKTMQVENYERSNGMILQNKIEAEADDNDKIKRFAIALRAKELADKTKKPETINSSDTALMSLLGITSDDVNKANNFINNVLNSDKLTDAFINENFKTAADFEKHITSLEDYKTLVGSAPASGTSGETTEKTALANHIKSLIRQKFEATQARNALKDMKAKNLISLEVEADKEIKINPRTDKFIVAPDDLTHGSSTPRTINISYNEAEEAGIKEIINIAEEMKITLVGSDNKTKFESLKNKYGDKTGVMQALASIQKDQLKLDGTRERGE